VPSLVTYLKLVKLNFSPVEGVLALLGTAIASHFIFRIRFTHLL